MSNSAATRRARNLRTVLNALSPDLARIARLRAERDALVAEMTARGFEVAS